MGAKGENRLADAMVSLGSLDQRLIGALGLTGILIGVVVAFGITGDAYWGELVAWSLLASLWIWVVLKQGTAHPFVTLLLVSVIAGLLFGATLQIFWGTYVDQHPGSFQAPVLDAGLDPYGWTVRAISLGLTTVFGALWGLILGGIGAGLAHARTGG